MPVKSVIVDTVTSAKTSTAIGVGISAPVWVNYLETVINPIVALFVALFTGAFMLTRFVNGLYEWRDNWTKRKREEREEIQARRKGE